MRLTMSERRSVVAAVAGRYQKAGKKRKREILDEFCQTTGYNRAYAALVLRKQGKRVRVSRDTALVGDARKRIKRRRPSQYDDEFVGVLKKIWAIMGFLCGKRLAASLKEVVPALERHGEIMPDKLTRERLMKVSPATIDRLLASERKRMLLKGRSGTKPGTLLKSQIPIRTSGEWDQTKPGCLEIDLVAHEGGNAQGDYCQTLDATDVFSGWTEMQAVQNKAQIWVFQALTEIKARLPFQLTGIDSDNGGEFINHHLMAYCRCSGIAFTRSRPYRKNDNCYVEQKNYSVVRKTVGYMRHDTREELTLLNELYSHLRLHTNFFQPVMKLKSKQREGSKVKKTYDVPETPYQRVLRSPGVPEANKRRLKKQHESLNPAQLSRDIERLKTKLAKVVAERQKKSKGNRMGCGKVEIEKRDFHFPTAPTTTTARHKVEGKTTPKTEERR